MRVTALLLAVILAGVAPAALARAPASIATPIAPSRPVPLPPTPVLRPATAPAVVSAAPAAPPVACAVEVVAPVSFGNYNPASPAPLDAIGRIAVQCGGAVRATVSLSPGIAGGFAPRAMRREGGGDLLRYNLYLDASHVRVWGDGTRGSATKPPATSADGDGTIPIFGRIPPGQRLPPGRYGDEIVVAIDL